MKPGIHTISGEQYHADPCDPPSLSASIAKLLITASPAHAREAHPRLRTGPPKREDDPKFDLGTAAHKLLLEGETVIEVVPFDDYRKADAKLLRDEARAAGRIPMLTSQSVEVYAMVNAVREQIAQLEMEPLPFTEGSPEQTLVWDEGGVTCRARVDWLHSGYAVVDDLKTTSRYANPEAWQRGPLYDHGCDLQAAMYLRGIRALTGVEASWRWVVVETQAPYALSVVAPSAAVLAIGDAKVDMALAKWRRCLETGVWPAYPRTVVEAELPAWIESRWLEYETREEVAA